MKLTKVRIPIMEKPRVLMLLSYFVPDPSSGTFRSLALANHLAEKGWIVEVITVSEADIPRADPHLYSKLDPRVHVWRFPKVDVLESFRRWLSRFSAPRSTVREGQKKRVDAKDEQRDYFQLSSRAMRWGWPLYWPDKSLQWALYLSVTKWVRELARSADVLYSSSPPESVHIAAAVLKKMTVRPWVADLRDPWADNPLRVLPPNPLARSYDRMLERLVLGRSDWIICNTPPMETAYRERFEGRVRRLSTVLNGFDDRIFIEQGSPPEVPDTKLRIIHTGSLYGQRDITPLLKALAALKRQRPAVAEDFRFQFVGPNTEIYQGMISSLELNNLVRLLGPVPIDEALELDRRAHVCLCIGLRGTQNQSQIPAKLYQFIGLGKPVLVLAKTKSAIVNVVAESGLQYFLADPDDESSILGAFLEIHATWTNGALRFGGSVAQRRRFARSNTARAIEDVLVRVLEFVR